MYNVAVGYLLFNNCINSEECHQQAYPVFRVITKETPVVIITAIQLQKFNAKFH